MGKRTDEARWLSGERAATEMIDHLEEAGRADARKLRLFACALARQLWDGFGHKTHGRVVELAEDFADGLIPFEDLAEAAAVAAQFRERYETEFDGAEICPGRVVFETAQQDPVRAAWWADSRASSVCGHLPEAPGAELYDGVALLREIFGNPFRPPSLGPAGVVHPGSAVAGLARAAYQERALPGGALDAARLGVLADALEEAGCEDAGVLGHLREAGPHVRGCWALDLILEQAGGFAAAPERGRKMRAPRREEGRALYTVEDILAAASHLAATELARLQEGLRLLEQGRPARQ